MTNFTAMSVRYFSLLLIPAMMAAGCATAKTKKKTTANVTLIEAYTKAMPAADAGNPPMTGDHFIIKWNNASYPETFFWRGQSGWLTCKIEKAHKFAKSNVYSTETGDGSTVHNGDTLMLSPVTGGRFAIPAEIPTTAKNTLYYKVDGGKWLSFPVKKITKK